MGILLGFCFIAASQIMDRTVRSPSQVHSHLQLSPLGVIPYARPELDQARVKYRTVNRGENGLHRSGSTRSSVELATLQHAPSMVAEAFRMSLASILFSERRNEVLVFTSAGSGEGKTSTVTNLAIALAEVGRKVVMIDGDLRRPRLHEIFDIPNTWGLKDLLRDAVPLDESCPTEALVKPTRVPGVSVLTSGPGSFNAASLLYSPRVEALLKRLRRSFDIILIDTPPMTHFPDARFLARLADGVVLVVRAGQTSCDAARATKERLRNDGANLLGTILTHWKPRTAEDKRFYDDYHREPKRRAASA
jgi:receptor protein-tyrosine kinase